MYGGMKIRSCLFIIILIAFFLGSTIGEDAGRSENNALSLWNDGSEPEIVINVSNEELLKLDDGYELAVRSADIDGNKVYLELLKNEMVVDSKVIVPANEMDGTFIYNKPGTSQEIVVHIKNTFRGADQNIATVDHIYQTSEIDPTRILINHTQSFTVHEGTPLRLQEGYELAVTSVDIDGNKAYIELLKDGEAVDSQVIVADNEVDDTFFYSKPGTELKIKVHFKNAFRGADQNLLTIDHVLQTSEIDPSRILINDNSSLTGTTGTALKLEEGYELAIKSVDIDGNKAYVELYKDGSAVDSKVIIAANDVDDTFVYSKPGTEREIKVHFKNAFRGRDRNLATIDSILQ